MSSSSLKQQKACSFILRLQFNMQESLDNQSRYSPLQPSTSWTVQFKLKRKINYEKAVYICGQNPQIGFWTPLKARRLHWTENDVWTITIQFSSRQPIAFKFITSDWQLTQHSNIQWESGKANRILSIDQHPQNLYQTVWNEQKIVLFLHCTHEEDDQQIVKHYVSGSCKELGQWETRKTLSPITTTLSSRLQAILKVDPAFFYEVNTSHFDFYSFTASRDQQQISYTYTRKGSTYESQMYLGRTISLSQPSIKNGRIHQLQYEGTRYVIDEPSFSQLVLQRLTSRLYIALNIRNNLHFQRVLQKKITILFNVSYTDEDCSINYFQISTLCKSYNVSLSTCRVDRKSNKHFLEQTKRIISNLEGLLSNGHRVCIYCSRNLIKSPPIRLLYMTLMEGCSLQDALQIINKEITLSQIQYKTAEDMFFMVGNKMGRAKIQIKTH